MEITSVGGTTPLPPGSVQHTESANPSQPTLTANKSQGSDSQVYQTPVVSFDSMTGDPVLQFRDPKSGDQVFQVPSHQSLEYARREHLTDEKPKAGNVVSV